MTTRDKTTGRFLRTTVQWSLDNFNEGHVDNKRTVSKETKQRMSDSQKRRQAEIEIRRNRL